MKSFSTEIELFDQMAQSNYVASINGLYFFSNYLYSDFKLYFFLSLIMFQIVQLGT